MYRNYKGFNSIVIICICDAKYRITYVDIGAYGRRGDSCIFSISDFGVKFETEQMNLPDPEKITIDGPPLPYCLVGDEAFPLSNYLQRPYPGKNISIERRIFNYRLSRARRLIENVFGILASRWRILRRPIDTTVDTAKKIVQATVVLHNYLRIKDIEANEYITPEMVDQENEIQENIPGSWRRFQGSWCFQDVTRIGRNNSTIQAMEIRDEFCKYFCGVGAVPWQYDKISSFLSSNYSKY